jgi:rhamnosyltransferase
MADATSPDVPSEAARSIYIVLATFNGARYLVEQVESIRAQTLPRWTLLARDDGSSDATVAILDDCAARDPRIEVLRDMDGTLGAIGNFSRLAETALTRGADVVFFADQDDLWFPDKVARTLAEMRATETALGTDHPILVHTDLQVVDGAGHLLHRSFHQLQRIRDERSRPLTTLLVQNYVTGCTMAANRALLGVALPVPADALMHDWWLALCAARCGSIRFLAAATAVYRRHGANTVTVRGFWRTMNPLRTRWIDLWHTGMRNHVRAVRQAEALASRLANRTGACPRAAAPVVQRFIELHDSTRSMASRVTAAWRLGLRSQAVPRTIALYARLLRWRP